MASIGLQLLTLLVLVLTAYGNDGLSCNHTEPNHLSTENDGDIKRVHCKDDGLNHLLSENDGDIKGVHIETNERTITGPPTLPSTFNPTPPGNTLPTVKPIASIIAGEPVMTSGPFITGRPVVTAKPIEAPGPIVTGRPVITAKPVTPAPSILGQTPPKRPVESTTKPSIVALPTPPLPEFAEFAPVCGRKKNCYQWFDEEWELLVDGYKRCNSRDERRAKRYCCVP